MIPALLRKTAVAVRKIIDSVGEVSMKRVDEYQLDSIECHSAVQEQSSLFHPVRSSERRLRKPETLAQLGVQATAVPKARSPVAVLPALTSNGALAHLAPPAPPPSPRTAAPTHPLSS
jgi:hypothetical protein